MNYERFKDCKIFKKIVSFCVETFETLFKNKNEYWTLQNMFAIVVKFYVLVIKIIMHLYHKWMIFMFPWK
jgi:hypothetical protein